MSEEKKTLIESTVTDFTKLDADNKMFILGYMLGVQNEKERSELQKKTA
jgi:uncharacterized membrane protein